MSKVETETDTYYADVWQGSRCKDAVREVQHIYNAGGAE